MVTKRVVEHTKTARNTFHKLTLIALLELCLGTTMNTLNTEMVMLPTS